MQLQVVSQIKSVTREEMSATLRRIRQAVVEVVAGEMPAAHLVDMLDSMAQAVDRWPEGSMAVVMLPVPLPARAPGEVA